MNETEFKEKLLSFEAEFLEYVRKMEEKYELEVILQYTASYSMLGLKDCGFSREFILKYVEEILKQ